MSDVSTARRPRHRHTFCNIRGSTPVVLALMKLTVFLLPTLAVLGPFLSVSRSVFAYRIAVALLVACSIVHLARNRHNLGKYTGLEVSIVVGFTFWLAYCIVSLVFRNSSKAALSEAIAIFVGCTLVVSLVLTSRSVSVKKALLHGNLLASLLTAIVGFREILTERHFPTYFRSDIDAPVARYGIASTLGNPNNYGLFLCVSLPLLAVGMFMTSRIWLRGIYLIAILSTPVLCYYTWGRISVAVLSVMFACLFLAIVIRRYLVTVLLLFVTAGVFFGIKVIRLLEKDSSGNVRLNLIKNGMMMALDTKFLGGGAGSFVDRMAAAQYPYDTKRVFSAHSGIIEILSEYGIAVTGFIAFLLLALIGLALGGHHAVCRTRSLRVEQASILLMSTLLPAYSMSNSSYLTSSISWLYLAALILLALDFRSKSALKSKEVSSS